MRRVEKERYRERSHRKGGAEPTAASILQPLFNLPGRSAGLNKMSDGAIRARVDLSIDDCVPEVANDSK